MIPVPRGGTHFGTAPKGNPLCSASKPVGAKGGAQPFDLQRFARALQRQHVEAARHYLLRLEQVPPCRFDVVALQGAGAALQIEWIRAAFCADGF